MLGLVVVLSLPTLISVLHLSLYQYGVLAGMSVYAVPQVVAAAFPVSELSGEVATMTKLARVMLLGPLVLLVGLLVASFGRRAGTRRGGLSTFVPWFVVGFIALGALRSLGLLPDIVAGPLREVGKWLTIVAMAGLGMGVRLAAIRSVGPRVLGAVVLSLATLIGLTLVLIRLFGVDGGPTMALAVYETVDLVACAPPLNRQGASRFRRPVATIRCARLLTTNVVKATIPPCSTWKSSRIR